MMNAETVREECSLHQFVIFWSFVWIIFFKITPDLFSLSFTSGIVVLNQGKLLTYNLLLLY